MNVIVSNRQKEIIDNANIDAIKDLNGLFNVDDLINKFKNYFFSRMILDATSVVNFASKQVLSTLASEIGPEKLIILLPSNPEPPIEFKKLLINLKIYNFTTSIDEAVKFIENPNTYEDAIKLIDDSSDGGMYVDNSIKEDDNGITENAGSGSSSLGDMLNNISVRNDEVQESVEEANTEEADSSDVNNNDNMNYTPDDNTESNSENDSSSESDDNRPSENVTSNSLFNEIKLESINNNTLEREEKKEETTESDSISDSGVDDNASTNTFLITDGFEDAHYNEESNKKTIIGVKNVTLHAGSTSLVYMLHKTVANVLKKSVLSIEIGKDDFRLLREKNMISVSDEDIGSVLDNAKEDIIIIDLNDFDGSDICTDVLYLVEPSTIMLNRLMATNRNAFKDLKNKKILLNKSMLSSNDVRTLSSEAGVDFFDVIEPLNDRIMNDSIAKLLDLLSIK